MMPYLPDMRAKLKHATGHRALTGTRSARIAQIYQYDPRRDDRENGARACRTICRTVACDSCATALTPRGDGLSAARIGGGSLSLSEIKSGRIDGANL